MRDDFHFHRESTSSLPLKHKCCRLISESMPAKKACDGLTSQTALQIAIIFKGRDATTSGKGRSCK